ncbi:MAG: serine esterase [Bdellovibrionota bacterium]
MNSSRQPNYRWNELRGQEQVADPNAPWVILFHGFGANSNDLYPLAEMFPTKKKWNWLFPQGPLEIPLGMGWTGRAWWDLDLEKMQRERDSGAERDPALENPPQLPLVREKVLKVIKDLKVPWSQIVLGGFSQGAMMALDVAFHAPEKPLGLVILSSNLVSKESWTQLAKNLESTPFYQSHGTQDAVLTYKNAQKLESFLKQHGLKGKLSAFNGAHEIPAKTISEVGSFLNDL